VVAATSGTSGSVSNGSSPGAGGQQYRKPQSEPSTYKAADVLSKSVTGEPVRRENKPIAGSAIHYAFGGAD